MNRTLLGLFLIFTACSLNPSNEKLVSPEDNLSECFCLSEALESKEALENGIRSKVKFTGEKEPLFTIEEKMVEYGIPALSLALMDSGRIHWSAVYQNPDYPLDSLNCTTLFQGASLAKPVSFMAAVRMAAAGEIDLDENIETYLQRFELPPGKQSNENPVTLRNIFAHTSGITPGGYEGYSRYQQMPTDIEVLRGDEGVNSRAIEVVNTPNEVLAYSGGGYTLAEVALQDHFDQEFADLMKEWILRPVGMTHSEFTQPMPSSDSTHIAPGFDAQGQMLEGGWRNHPEQAAAGLWSTASDLALFLTEIYKAYHGQSEVFAKADIDTLLSHERERSVYGFIVNRSDDDLMLTHYGGNQGYRTGMTISLISGKGLAYLINSDNGIPLGNELLLSAAQVFNWDHYQQIEATRTTVGVDTLKMLAGKYLWENEVPLSITYEEATHQLTLNFPNGQGYGLVPVEGPGLAFIDKDNGVEISFGLGNDWGSFMIYDGKAVVNE